MQERKPGCICELDTESGEPVVESYEMCPVHKADAPTPKSTANEIFMKYWDDCSPDHAKWCTAICIDEIIDVLKSFSAHEYAKVLLPHYEQAKLEIPNLWVK